MRSKEPLIILLRRLVDVIADEATHNRRFANKLNDLLDTDGSSHVREKRTVAKHAVEDLPDIHKEWNSRGEDEFRLWLRHETVEVLKAIIRREDLDAAKRAAKWKDAEKLADFISDGLKARMSRGSAFITPVVARTEVPVRAIEEPNDPQSSHSGSEGSSGIGRSPGGDPDLTSDRHDDSTKHEPEKSPILPVDERVVDGRSEGPDSSMERRDNSTDPK
jgi:hypothetical protein